MAQEAPDVLAPHQQNVLTEPFPIKIDEGAPVLVFLGGHVDEDLRGRGKIGFQPIRIVGVEPGVLLLETDCKGQQLLLAQLGDGLQSSVSRCSFSLELF